MKLYPRPYLSPAMRERQPAYDRASLLHMPGGAAVAGSTAARNTGAARQDPCQADRVAWAGRALRQMLLVKPGMTRADVMRIMTTEGGICFPEMQRFVSRDCPYFKLKVWFRPSSPGFAFEPQDVVVKVLQPFWSFRSWTSSHRRPAPGVPGRCHAAAAGPGSGRFRLPQPAARISARGGPP